MLKRREKHVASKDSRRCRKSFKKGDWERGVFAPEGRKKGGTSLRGGKGGGGVTLALVRKRVGSPPEGRGGCSPRQGIDGKNVSTCLADGLKNIRTARENKKKKKIRPLPQNIFLLPRFLEWPEKRDGLKGKRNPCGIAGEKKGERGRGPIYAPASDESFKGRKKSRL